VFGYTGFAFWLSHRLYRIVVLFVRPRMCLDTDERVEENKAASDEYERYNQKLWIGESEQSGVSLG